MPEERRTLPRRLSAFKAFWLKPNKMEFNQMSNRLLTVVRFPNGTWSTGGPVSDPDYAMCEVYVVPFKSDAEARKMAQAVRRRLVSKALPVPSQGAPYRHPLTV